MFSSKHFVLQPSGDDFVYDARWRLALPPHVDKSHPAPMTCKAISLLYQISPDT